MWENKKKMRPKKRSEKSRKRKINNEVTKKKVKRRKTSNIIAEYLFDQFFVTFINDSPLQLGGRC